jgi:hypothetical protein
VRWDGQHWRPLPRSPWHRGRSLWSWRDFDPDLLDVEQFLKSRQISYRTRNSRHISRTPQVCRSSQAQI